MISTFLLACFLLLMCVASFAVGMVVTYKAFESIVDDVEKMYPESSNGAKWEALKVKVKKLK